MSALPDLSSYKNTELVTVNRDKIDQLESDLRLYRPMLRALQLQPLAYTNFWREVLFPIRQKHIVYLRRGTDASIQSLTEIVLRGFGRHIWNENSPWLIETSQLEETEERLLHDRKGGNSANARLFAVFEPLWKQMRNIMFEPRELDERLVHRQSVEKAVPGIYSNPDDVFPDTSKVLTFSHHSDTSIDIIRKGNGDKWSAARVDAQICKIAQLLADTIQNSDELVFEAIWKERVGEISEESVNRVTASANLNLGAGSLKSDELGHGSSSTSPMPAIQNVVDQMTLANEPWISGASRVSMRHAASCFVQNDSPEYVAVWISKAKVISYGEPISISASPSAWHLPSIRVTPDSMRGFLGNIDTRADVPDDCLTLCYVLSYGWNDTMSIINTDEPTAVMEDESPFESKLIAGWKIFQENLREATLAGNTVWRMKVLVLYSACKE